jgi:hypothetical protein
MNTPSEPGRAQPEEAKRAPNHVWKPAFLKSYADTGNVRLSCAAAGIERSTYYAALQSDETFVQAVALAREEAADVIEARAFEGASLGFEEKVFFQGQDTGQTVRKIDTGLIKLLLAALKPEIYGKQRHEHTGAGGGPIRFRGELDLSVYTTEELMTLRALSAKQRKERDG